MKNIKFFLIPMALILTVYLSAQDNRYNTPPNTDCPEGVEYHAPGAGEQGCINYTDCNGNGAFDIGEPCFDGYAEGQGYGGGEYANQPATEHPVDMVQEQYGDHTWKNCEAISMGASTYWIGNHEYATYNDPLCASVYHNFYEAIDANHDGAINYDEAAVVWGDNAESQSNFSEADANHNGFVDEDEFMAATAPPEEAYNAEDTHAGAGYYCAICDLHFATAAEMDQHAAQMGHTTGFQNRDCNPDVAYPVNPPGYGQGCSHYTDCNGNGVFDIGEPCFE